MEKNIENKKDFISVLWPENKILNLNDYGVNLSFVIYPKTYDMLAREIKEDRLIELFEEIAQKKKIFVYADKNYNAEDEIILVVGEYLLYAVLKEPSMITDNYYDDDEEYDDDYNDVVDEEIFNNQLNDFLSGKTDTMPNDEPSGYCFLIYKQRRKSVNASKLIAKKGVCIICDNIGFAIRRGQNNDATFGNYMESLNTIALKHLIIQKSESEKKTIEPLSDNFKTILSYAEKFVRQEDEKEKTLQLVDSECNYSAFNSIIQLGNEDAKYEFSVDKIQKSFEPNIKVSINDLDSSREPILGDLISIDEQNKKLVIVFHEQVSVNDIPENGVIKKIYFNVQTRVKLDTINKLKNLECGQQLNAIFKNYETAGFNDIDIEEMEEEWNSRKYPPNPSQKKAIRNGIKSKDITLVLGPPGTGKTTVILEWAKYFINQDKRVLVSSQNNKAVDNVLERLKDDYPNKVARIGNLEKVQGNVQEVLYQKKVSDLSSDLFEKAKYNDKLFAKQMTEANSAYNKACQKAKEKLEEKIAKETIRIDEVKKEIILRRDNKLSNVKDYYSNFEANFKDYNKVLYKEIESNIYELYKKMEKTYENILTNYKVVKEYNHRIKEKFNLFKKIEQKTYDKEIDNLNNLINEYNSYSKEIDNYNAKLKSDNLDDWLKENGYLINNYQNVYNERSSDLDFIIKMREKLLFLVNLNYDEEINNECNNLDQQLKNYIKSSNNEYDNQIKDFKSNLDSRLNSLRILKENNLKWLAELSVRNDAIASEILINTMRVIGATCVGINSNKIFKNVKFDVTIIDEAGQIQIHNALIPMSKSDKIIMLGDHKQIPPMPDQDVLAYVKQMEYECDNSKQPTPQELYENSFFQYLYEKAIPESNKVLLNTQFRMPNTVADIISEAFYDGKYFSADFKKNLPAIDPKIFGKPLCLIDTIDGNEDRRETKDIKEGQVKYYNKYEAKIIIAIVNYLIRNNIVAKEEIGVIVPYSYQLKYIREQLTKELEDLLTHDDIKDLAGTLDSFQGQERDVIIYGITRSNNKEPKEKRIGFLSELRRFNVALTRCKKQVIIIGDFKFLMECENDVTVTFEQDENDIATYKPSTEKQFGEFVKLMINSVNKGNGEIIPSKTLLERINK